MVPWEVQIVSGILHLNIVGGGLSLDADHRFQFCHQRGEAGMMTRFDHRGDILVGAGGLFGNTAQRGAADQDVVRGEIADDPIATPQLARLATAHAAACAMARRTVGDLHPLLGASEDIGGSPHGTADQDGLA